MKNRKMNATTCVTKNHGGGGIKHRNPKARKGFALLMCLSLVLSLIGGTIFVPKAEAAIVKIGEYTTLSNISAYDLVYDKNTRWADDGSQFYWRKINGNKLQSNTVFTGLTMEKKLKARVPPISIF